MGQGTADREAAGAWTRKMAGVVLSNALRHAVRLKLIPHNPAADVTKARPAEREMQFLTERQGRRLLEAARGHRLYALFTLALGSGMRQGELLGLQWGDIDFERGTLEVRRTLTWVKKEPVLKEPKSKASRRKIAVPKFALDALWGHRQAALKAGLITAPVFCTKNGTFIAKSNFLRQVFRPLVKRANGKVDGGCEGPDQIPVEIRFHDLRHSHASCLVAAGHSIKAVSRRLGHAGIGITLRVYAHLMPNDDDTLATGADALFG
jgi:integrase